MQRAVNEILDGVYVRREMEVALGVTLSAVLAVCLAGLQPHAQFLNVVAEVVLRNEFDFVLLNFLVIGGVAEGAFGVRIDVAEE